MTSPSPPPPTLRELAAYFLRLGAVGFGGPVALADHMRRDLVEARGWISPSEYETGLAIAAACPGPLAYQLGVYCGYVRYGAAGGLLVAVAFALAPFVLVVLGAAVYVRLAGLWQVRALFYGVGPVVVALILRAGWNLGRKTLKRDTWAWVFAVIACAVTVVVQRELTVLFVVAGLLGIFVFGQHRHDGPAPGTLPPASTKMGAFFTLGAPVLWPKPLAAQLFVFFFKTGLLVFGSGLVIVPFLKTYVVDEYHWLNNRQFLDAVAIGMISPGPVVITASFVGYLVDGLSGAIAATVGIFAPAVLLTILATPLLLRHQRRPALRGFIRGVTAAVVGVLTGTTYLVARTAVGDPLTATLAVLSLVVVARWRRIPEPLIVLLGAVVGLLAFPLLRPDWLP